MLNSRGRSPPYQLDSRGRLVLPEAQVADKRDYVCVVKAGAAGTAEATARLNVYGECLCLPLTTTPPNTHTSGKGQGGENPGKQLLTVSSSRSQTRGPGGLPLQRNPDCDEWLCRGGTLGRTLFPGF